MITFHSQFIRACNSNVFIKTKVSKINIILALKHSDVVFILLVNIKMPTTVGILIFTSRTFHTEFELHIRFITL